MRRGEGKSRGLVIGTTSEKQAGVVDSAQVKCTLKRTRPQVPQLRVLLHLGRRGDFKPAQGATWEHL